MIWLLACTSRCPEGVEDPSREARLQALAPGVGEVCFSDRSGLIGETVVLDASRSDEALAARATHLERHKVGQPRPGPGCEARWLEMEVEGWRAELQVRLVLGEPAELPFEAAWRRSLSDDVIRTWLIENPHGGGEIDGLMAGYAARCAE